MSFLKIKGFKCFEDIEVPLKQLTVLAGANSVGKSSVIQILLLLRIASNYEEKTSLNGEYLLKLGNSAQVLSKRGGNANEIYARLEWNEIIYAETKWQAALSRPQPYLTVLETDGGGIISDVFNFHYLHAERLGPRPHYLISGKERNVGWQGENTIAVLSDGIIDTPDYDVDEKKLFPNSKISRLRSQVELWMNYIIPGIDVDAKRIQEINQAFVLYNGDTPYNVGFGISYVLPIITAGLLANEDEMFIVENPEAHLHPSGQSRIGQFLAIVAASGVLVIIETHSEHIINGIRLASLKEEIEHEDVVINFFSKKEEDDYQPNIDSIFLNTHADLKKWPLGFFDQQQQDIGEIFRLRKKMNQ